MRKETAVKPVLPALSHNHILLVASFGSVPTVEASTAMLHALSHETECAFMTGYRIAVLCNVIIMLVFLRRLWLNYTFNPR